jgi:hypothetical protein
MHTDIIEIDFLNYCVPPGIVDLRKLSKCCCYMQNKKADIVLSVGEHYSTKGRCR